MKPAAVAEHTPLGVLPAACPADDITVCRHKTWGPAGTGNSRTVFQGQTGQGNAIFTVERGSGTDGQGKQMDNILKPASTLILQSPDAPGRVLMCAIWSRKPSQFGEELVER